MEFSSQELHALAILVRLSERLVLLFVVVSLVVILMIAFRRRVQVINAFSASEDLPVRVEATFLMPVFLLLVLCGFSYVTYSSPVLSSLSPSPQAEGTGKEPGGDKQKVDKVSAESSSSQVAHTFNGFGGLGEDTYQDKMDALTQAIESLKNEGTLDANRAMATLIVLRNDILLSTYGQPLIDACRDHKSTEYGDIECERFRKWEQY